MEQHTYLSAQEAAQKLEVSVGTLYSYVSRGLVRSLPTSRDKRQRRYSLADINRLREHNILRSDPQGALLTTLRWGSPVLESQVTLIDGGRYYYRGLDAVDLAKSYTFEDAARLIWDCDYSDLFSGPIVAVPLSALQDSPSWSQLTSIERFQAVLPMAQAVDPAAYATTRTAVVKTGARIVRLLAHVATEGASTRDNEDSSHEGIASILRDAWASKNEKADGLLDMALVLLADHELNFSSFAARCVASAGSTPYAVVQAGLAALQGFRHGGMTTHALEMFGEASELGKVPDIVASRLKKGETIPGFGHPLYPEGDPRFEALSGRIKENYSDSHTVALCDTFVDVVGDMTGGLPNIDLAIATMCRVLRIPHSAAIAIFSISRTVGWIAQAIEQYELGTLIRPRANYTGPLPS